MVFGAIKLLDLDLDRWPKKMLLAEKVANALAVNLEKLSRARIAGFYTKCFLSLTNYLEMKNVV